MNWMFVIFVFAVTAILAALAIHLRIRDRDQPDDTTAP